MQRQIHFAAFVGLALCAVQLASPVSAEAPEGASEEQIAANAVSKRLGEQIYRHDQAAWHASDTLYAKLNPADHPELRSYVSEELGNGNIGLVFYSEADGKLFEFARYEMDAGKVISGGRHENPTAHPLPKNLLRQVAARKAALEEGALQKLPMCGSGTANVVSLPPDEKDQIAVYILSSPMVRGRFPLGGHYRIDVGADGKPVSGRGFENGCRDAPRMERYMLNAPADYQLVHQLDPHPTEIHHYAARNMNLALQITAANVTWKIDYVKWSESEIAAGEAMVQGKLPAKP